MERNHNERKMILEQELKKLVDEGYISESSYAEVLAGYNQYHLDLEGKKMQATLKAEVTREQIEVPIKHEMVKPKKEKKVLSPQQVRERNITWALNLGVILLLLGGLVLATSTWDTLGNWTKTGLIALVSVLFFGLAIIAKRILHIEKTAYAFLVLGSLFLPIVIVSAGYFELFGTYFSFFGEGRYLYGAAGSLAVLPIYIYLSTKLGSRLFTWFAYVTISGLASFAIASLYLPVEGFYFGLMLFNALLMVGYQFFRKNNRYEWFTKEFIPFIQANLILSTLFMLVFYNNELLYSFNIIVTAILYLAMIYVTNQKSYHFVFSLLLIYGVYQLIETTVLNEVGSIVYALLGVAFIAVPKLISGRYSLNKAFQYTSAVVSFLAFLYISVEGLVLRMNEPSIVLLIAYLIVSANYVFLANTVKHKIFNYLSPIFFVSALYEMVLLGAEWFNYETVTLPLFIIHFLFYIIIGCYIKISFFQVIKESTRDVFSIIMLFCLLFSLLEMNWWQSGTMFLFLSILGLVMEKFEDRKTLTEIAPWLHTFGVGFAVVTWYAVFLNDWQFIYIIPIQAEGIVLSGLLLLLVSYLWKLLKQSTISHASFFGAQLFYGYGMVLSLFVDDWLRVVILLGGGGVAYLLYRKTKWFITPYLMSSFTLLFYLSFLYAAHPQIESLPVFVGRIQLVIGAVLLLVIGLIWSKQDRKIGLAYYGVSHLYLPFALIISLFSHQEHAVWTFVIATFIYGSTVKHVRQEWKRKLFLYGAFTTFWAVTSLIILLIDLNGYSHYGFLVTSIVIAGLWYFSRGEWTKRIAYYLVPFSVIGIVAFADIYPFEINQLAVTMIYAVGLLFIMYRQKWSILQVIPLMLIYASLHNYGEQLRSEHLFILLTAYAVVLTLIGYVWYKTILPKSNGKFLFHPIDWYSIIGFLTLLNLYEFQGYELWMKVIPGLLISIYLFVQRKRIPFFQSKWLVFGAGIYLLQPYYVLLGFYELPELFARELYLLPWVIYVILFKKYMVPQRKELANNIQWAVLVIVALLLVQDGLASNTIYDALIVGILSLASLIGGMIYQLKSFFFVGTGVLVLNVFLQTRPYWGNLPWWGYLLIAGSILIAVASYHEWHKQKTSDGKETLLTKFNKKVIQKIKNWE